MTAVLAFENPFAKFGVTSWEPLVANAIAFLVAAYIIKKLALKPIQKMLDERKQQIADTVALQKKTEEALASVNSKSETILDEAREKGDHLINDAKQAAEQYLEKKQEETNRQMNEILQKSRESAALEAQQARKELRQEFAQLIAQTTGQVTGKILTDADRQAINNQTIDSLS